MLDRSLSDEQWADIAAEYMDRIGLAPRVLTKLRRRERRPVFRFPACVDHGALPSDGSKWHLDTSCSPGAVSHTTH